LAAAGQANRPGPHVRAAAGAFGQLAQGDVPAIVGGTVLVEVETEEHRGAHLQPRIDQYVGRTHLPVGKFGQVDHAVQDRFEFREQHFLADAVVAVEQHGFDHLRFVLHARHPSIARNCEQRFPGRHGLAKPAPSRWCGKFRGKLRAGNVTGLAVPRPSRRGAMGGPADFAMSV